MERDVPNAGVLRWRGMFVDATMLLRCVTAAMLALTSVTFIVTQWGYLGVQLANGTVTYLLCMLAPIALAALLLGTLPGAAVGFLSGAVLYFHALVIPLDYYELTRVTPITSVVAMTAFGFILGILFALVLRRHSKGRLRVVLLLLVCFVASGLFSALCVAGMGLHAQTVQETAGAVTSEGIAFQAIGDGIILSFVTIVSLTLVERIGVRVNLAGLRTVFAARLIGVVLAAFMLVAMLAYGSVTASKITDSLRNMKSEAEYLLDQVICASAYDEKANWELTSTVDASPESAQAVEELNSGGLIWSLIKGYTEDEDGLVLVSVAGQLLGVDVDRLGITPGMRLEEFLSADMLDAIQRSIEDDSLEQVVYLAPSDYNNLIHLDGFEPSADPVSHAVQQVGYLVAIKQDAYQVVIIRPASMVFADRYDIVSWITAASLGLLVAVSVLMWWLLDRLVARRIDATNAALERITQGDLEARVEPKGTFEFQELSVGINETVDVLQSWIAEAEMRMDAELATAGIIQDSALPNIFPPFPDIQRFDIFASMSAAREVGGDFYDYFLLGDECGPTSGKLGFVVADVSGKGVPAALFMMKAKTQIRDYLESGMELGEAIENANRRLCEGNEEGMFVTAWVGVLDYGTGHIDYVNAGHNPPLLWQDGSWRWLRELSGIPLGLLDELPYTTHALDCVIGDQLLLYTDGVTEAFSVDEAQFGEERLERLVSEYFTLHPRELVQHVRASVAEYAEGTEQFDDITLLALEVGVPPEKKAQIVVPAHVDEISRVFDFIHAALDRRLCPGRVQGQLGVAVEELFVNVCKYAYEGMRQDMEPYVRVTYSYSADPVSATVEIIDNGMPFDPLAQPDETIGESATLDDIGIGGLGILMAKKSVDEMTYERVDDSNVVTLVKYW